MTPDERAAQAVPRNCAELGRDDLIARVAEAIRDAVADERRACARLAAVMGMPRAGSEPSTPAQPEQLATARLAVRIAEAIEARGKS